MIEVTINLDDQQTKTFNFPENWDEVTVKQFCKLSKLHSNENQLMGAVNMISAISDIDTGILFDMDVDDFRNLASTASFITQEVTRTDTEFIEINGEKYFLYTDFNKLTTGEVITVETLIDGSGGDLYSVMGDILCVFLRKKNEDGTFEKFNTNMLKRKEMFLELPISQIYHIFAFFLDGNNSSINNMKGYTRNNDQSTTPKEDLQNG